MSLKIGLIGFGNVGQGLAQILIDKKTFLKEKFDFEYSLVAVCDKMKGSIACESGLEIEPLLRLAGGGKSLEDYQTDRADGKAELYSGWDALTMIEKTGADVICELSFTDLKTGEPAVSHCRRAFAAGKSVVTSNKGPAVLALAELRKLAKEKGVHFFYEGTVMSGTPVINLMEFCLAGNEINEIKGILNGTTNYILTRMHEGMAYDEALKKAQALGYAEADPTGDVEGFDAMAKVVILANCLMDAGLTPGQVDRKGISGITKDDIKSAEAQNRRWKLISHLKREGGGLTASVKPMALPASDPLSSINGATNALTYSTDLMGDVTVIGAGAGRIETGFSILIDLLRLHAMRD